LRSPSDRLDAPAWGLVGAVFVTHLSAVVMVYALGQQYPVARLGAGPAFAGFVLSAYILANLAAQPLHGWLADRVEPRLILAVDAVVSLGPILWAMTARQPSGFLAGCALLGVTHAGLWPCAFSIVGHRYSPQLRGRLSAALDVTLFAGLAAGFAGGAFLIQAVGFRAAFWLAAAAMAAGAPLALWQPPVHRPGEALPRVVWGKRLRQLRDVLGSDVALLLLAAAGYNLAGYLLLPSLRAVSQRLGIDFATLILVALPALLLGGAAILPAGWLADHLPRRPLVLTGLTVVAASFALLGWVRSPWIFGLVMCLLVLGFTLVLPAWNALLLDVVAPQRRGLVLGLGGTLSGVGAASGSALGGMAAAAWGIPTAFLLAAAATAGSTALVAAFPRRRRQG
jgi:MFS family permease